MDGCSQEHCYWQDNGCLLGEMDPSRCRNFNVSEVGTRDDRPTDADATAVPWSGGAMGLSDLAFVAGAGKPLVLGIVGPENAGKTTLLASWYLLLSRGADAGDGRRFAGSCSLAGWEAIASHMRWSPGPVPPTFPPHTTSREDRTPGLLHLAFAKDGRRPVDYVMSDAPGEWFRAWATNRDADGAAGARWVVEHADAFLLIADRGALSGEDMGVARGAIQGLAQRLGAEGSGRPVALVWTKDDVVIAADMEKSVRDSVRSFIPDVEEFRVSIRAADGRQDGIGRGFMELLRWSLSVRRGCVRVPEPGHDAADPLFLFGVR